MPHALILAPALKPILLGAAAVALFLRATWNKGPAPHWADYLHEKKD